MASSRNLFGVPGKDRPALLFRTEKEKEEAEGEGWRRGRRSNRSLALYSLLPWNLEGEGRGRELLCHLSVKQEG